MAIGIYFHPSNMTAAQYDEINKRLQVAAGGASPKGMLFHSCFGEGDSLSIYDVWDSRENFDAFGQTLMPVLQELGIEAVEPDVVPIYDMVIP